MKPYPCGCTADGTTRCDIHASYPCHIYPAVPYASPNSNGEPAECPPCKLARLRSVNLDSSATPTRGGGK